MCCWFAVCPVPKTKEEEEFIKERERNRELMEEIAREIEMTCLGKLKNEKTKKQKTKNKQTNNNNKNLGWASPSARIACPFERLNPLGQLGMFHMEQYRVWISEATLTYLFSLRHLVGNQRIQEVITYIHCMSTGSHFDSWRRIIRLKDRYLSLQITHPAQERLGTPRG